MKLCHVITIWVHFLMQVQKFWDSPLKKIGAKNMQNLGPFYTTSKFDRECFRNETRYPKLERYVIENYSSHIRRNKSGERSTIQKVGHVSLDPSRSTFSADNISAPRGYWPLKFLHVLEINHGLTAHTANWVGVPQKF